MRLFTSSLRSKTEDDVHVFILTGQSNAVGFSLNSDALASELDANPIIQIWQKGADYETLDISSANNYAREGEPEHGLELGWSDYINQQVYLIKWGVGSTSIVEHLEGASVYEELYNNFFIPGKARIEELHPTDTIHYHLVWWQGEGDRNTSAANAYDGRFQTWFDLWSTNLSGEVHDFHFCEINESGAEEVLINDSFRTKAQEEANAYVYDTQGLEMSDDFHYKYSAKKIVADMILTQIGIRK